MATHLNSTASLEVHGIQDAVVHWNLSVPALYEEAIIRREGVMADGGALVCTTGLHTGRSPGDKLVVREPSSEERIWWGKVNKPLDSAHFERLRGDVLDYARGKELFVQDLCAGADPEYRLPIRVITETAWHSLFARTVLMASPDPGHEAGGPEFTIIDVPKFKAALRQGRTPRSLSSKTSKEDGAHRQDSLRRGDQVGVHDPNYPLRCS